MNPWQRFCAFFKSETPPPPPPTKSEYFLRDLKLGFLLDYSLSTWKVTKKAVLNTGELLNGFKQIEYTLKNIDPNNGLDMPDTLLLIAPTDDDDEDWAVCSSLPIMKFDPSGLFKKHMDENREPPEEYVCLESKQITEHFTEITDTQFIMEEKSEAFYDQKVKLEVGAKVQKFNYFYMIDKEDEKFLRIEDWGDEEDGDYVIYLGRWVKDSIFTNIIPKEWINGS